MSQIGRVVHHDHRDRLRVDSTAVRDPTSPLAPQLTVLQSTRVERPAVRAGHTGAGIVAQPQAWVRADREEPLFGVTERQRALGGLVFDVVLESPPAIQWGSIGIHQPEPQRQVLTPNFLRFRVS